jgi:DNA mismatch repair protein MutL
MARIARLPLLIANQIAAGEVIERPASVVKELVENAIDAKASRIVIEVKEGGRWIKVVDDGLGIASDQLALAFERFATSKLRDEGELWHLTTHGFRGEALASIASIAKLVCQSRAKDELDGAVIEIAGGAIIRSRAQACAQGCSIVVSDLFYNTPARLKFLRSPLTEQGHIYDVVLGLGLCHPHLDFKLLINGREALNTIGYATLREVVTQVFKDVSADHYLDVAHADACGKIHGIITKPDYARPDRARQHLFVNRRWVRHALLAKAVEETFQGHLSAPMYPAFTLFLELDPQRVDVNVHPTKKEVRLNQTQRTHYLVKEAIAKAIGPAPPRNYAPHEAWTSRHVDLPLASNPAPSGRDAAVEGQPGFSLTLKTLSYLPWLTHWKNRYLLYEHPRGLLIVTRRHLLEAITRAALTQQRWQWDGLDEPIVLQGTHAHHPSLIDHWKNMGIPIAALTADLWQVTAKPQVFAGAAFRQAIRRAWRLGIVADGTDANQGQAMLVSAMALQLETAWQPDTLRHWLDTFAMNPVDGPEPRLSGVLIFADDIASQLEPDDHPL